MKFLGKNITIKRGHRTLFHNLNFQLKNQEIMQIIGANGSGKSTLLRIIAGFLKPQTGTLILKCEHESYSLKNYIHYLDTKEAMKPHLTLQENLHFWQKFYGEDPQKSEKIIERFNLSYFIDLPFHLLSTGLKKRVAFARILLTYRPIWLLDEPLIGLDENALDIISELMEEHLIYNGMIIFTSHQNAAPLFKDKIFLREKYHSLHLQDFII